VPTALVLASDILLGILDAEKNKNYRSEWLDEGSVLVVMAIMSLMHSGLVCMLSLTMFFNELEQVEKNAPLGLLAWFLIPLSWLGYLMGATALDGFRHVFNDGHVWVFLNTAPYAAGLVLTYISFRKELINSMLLV
jgi:hypothetical protein